jgi:hypothetical protein
MYLIRSMRSEPLMRVGAGFGLNRYSSVSSAVMRIKTKLQNDKKLNDRLEHIENNILKGQTKNPNFYPLKDRRSTPQTKCSSILLTFYLFPTFCPGREP